MIKRRYAWSVLALLVATAWVVPTLPTFAHGEDGEAEPVELVEQALAIVVNSPDSMVEADEKIEAALAADPAELGELDVEALDRAMVAVRAGDAHAAEDALVEALRRDPHPEEPVEEPAAVSDGTGTTTAAPTTSPESADPSEEAVVEEETEGEDVESGLFSTPVLDHGLTERIRGGLRSPSGAALILVVILAGFGTYLLRHRESDT